MSQYSRSNDLGVLCFPLPSPFPFSLTTTRRYLSDKVCEEGGGGRGIDSASFGEGVSECECVRKRRVISEGISERGCVRQFLNEKRGGRERVRVRQ